MFCLCHFASRGSRCSARKMKWLNVWHRLGFALFINMGKILKIRSGLFIFVGLISNRSYLRFVCPCSQTVPKDPSLHFQLFEREKKIFEKNDRPGYSYRGASDPVPGVSSLDVKFPKKTMPAIFYCLVSNLPCRRMEPFCFVVFSATIGWTS